MLSFLHIENIAVIKKLDIDFNSGFTALTGETGAGKSIIIDGIGLLMGERGSRELIRSGEDHAAVSAIFEEIGDDAQKALAELDIFPDENEIARKLKKDTVTSAEIKKAITQAIRDVNKRIPSYKNIRDTVIRKEEFSKTTTHKIKRHQ